MLPVNGVDRFVQTLLLDQRSPGGLTGDLGDLGVALSTGVFPRASLELRMFFSTSARDWPRSSMSAIQYLSPAASGGSRRQEDVGVAAAALYAWLQKSHSPLRALMHSLSMGSIFYSGACAEKVCRASIASCDGGISEGQWGAAAQRRHCMPLEADVRGGVAGADFDGFAMSCIILSRAEAFSRWGYRG